MKFSEAYNIICLKNDAKEMLLKEFSQIILRTKVKNFDTYETKQDIVFSKIKKICDVKITFPNELSFVSAGDEKLIVDGEGNVTVQFTANQLSPILLVKDSDVAAPNSNKDVNTVTSDTTTDNTNKNTPKTDDETDVPLYGGLVICIGTLLIFLRKVMK